MDAESSGGTKKRGAPEGGEGLSLDAIREVIKGEISQSVNRRMDTVEEKVGKQLERTLEKLAAMTDTQAEQGRAIAAVQAEQKDTGGRLAQLEQKVHQLQLHGGSSTADTEGGMKQPALILGGWPDDSPASETLEKAKDMMKQLRVDLDMEAAFCPGIRRGYVIIPYKARPNETGGELRDRLQQALRRVRTANIAMARKDDGSNKYLWMQMSQSPERRRRAHLAGKVKRLILSAAGGPVHGLEVEWPTGTVWWNATRVCTATTTLGPHAEQAGAGWVDLHAIAAGLGEEPTGSTEGSDREDPSPEPQSTFVPLKGVDCFHLATWNVGGLTADGTLDLLRTFGGAKHLCMLHVIMLQEIITNAGKCFKEKWGWKMVYGKQEGEFRGEAIAFRTDVASHTQSTVTSGAVSTVLRLHTSEKWGLLSGHIPHHATIPEVDTMLHHWGDQPALRTPKAAIGTDANEQFAESRITPTTTQAHTGRGETVLNWSTHHGFRLPPQAMNQPSYYPYNTRHDPSRLDYIMIRKGYCLQAGPIPARDMASSDHEPILAQLRAKVKKLAKTVRQGGVRHLHPPPGTSIPDYLDEQAATAPADRHHQIATVCQAITKPGRGDTRPFCESSTLRTLRRQAQQTPPGAERRAAWKAVQQQLKGERKLYLQQLVKLASTKDWPAYRAQQRHTSKGDWIALLLDAHDWQSALLDHFSAIFAKADGDAKATAFKRMHHQLTTACKHTAWRPFTRQELLIVSSRWGKHKSTGVDNIAHEALQLLILHPIWGERVLAMLNEALYVGKLPALVERGLTILLPKGGCPTGWSDTRPITLSSAVLKTIAQLLLLRGTPCLQHLNTYQWAAPRRQGVELILVLRKIARMGADWGGDFWIIKLDLQKAFDSVAQDSLAELVATEVGGTMPWEARLWLSLLDARRIHVAIGGREVEVDQTNGVRQGSPDSPVLFSARVGELLERTLSTTQTEPRGGTLPFLPPPPHHGGSFMDDTYLWGENPAHLQLTLNHLERLLLQHGLRINPKKTHIISNNPKSTITFTVGGETVTPDSGDTPLRVLGSPVSFRGSTPQLAAEMGSRARAAFAQNRKVLTAPTPPTPRLQLHETLVRQTALYGCETWQPHDTLLRAANTQQLSQLRNMTGGGRRPGEQWHEWNTRTLRQTRGLLHRTKGERWSTYILRMIWRLWGHAVRGGGVTRDMLLWRGLAFWRTEQRKHPTQGARHAARFCSQMDTERQIAAIAGEQWPQVALDRQRWHQLEQAFVERYDPPWASGKQPQLTNLAPGRTARNNTRHRALPATRRHHNTAIQVDTQRPRMTLPQP
ncbi:unnamed protein product [Symbiodinium sp. CCMP2592]|nr:unnamed protein product [Symbiodinium sp. CCMP2592]